MPGVIFRRNASHIWDSLHPHHRSFISLCFSTNLNSLLSSVHSSEPSRCFRGYHTASEGSTLTFDVAQNWISSVVLCLSPSWSVIHAVTNWVACQKPGCLNGWLLVNDLCFFFFKSYFVLSDALWVHQTEKILSVKDSPIQKCILFFVNVLSCSYWMWPCMCRHLADCDI